MNTIGKAMSFVSLINSPYLQVYPDMGNITNAVSDVLRDVESGKGHIVAAHLKETKPGVFRDLFFGEGHVSFDAVISSLKKQGVSMFTAEFWFRNTDAWMRDICDAHNFLSPFLEKK